MSPLPDHPAGAALRRYVAAVAQAVEVEDEATTVLVDGVDPSAYLALPRSHPTFPEMALALLWNLGTGWASALETRGGDLITLAYVGTDLLPSPGEVGTFLRDTLDGGYPGQPDPPRLDTTVPELTARLARYG